MTTFKSAKEFFSTHEGIVTLCGSTKYFDECLEVNRQLTFQGWMVFMCGSWGHSYHAHMENTNTDYAKVKRMHFLKILKSQAIVVVSGTERYLGKSTLAEIAFASHYDIPIFFYENSSFCNSFTFSNSTPLNYVNKLHNMLLDDYIKTNRI